MSNQILFWTDTIGSVKHGTFVTKSGHVLLRNVPIALADEFYAGAFRDFRNGLTSIENVTNEDVSAFLTTFGATPATETNPNILAFDWPTSTGTTVDPEDVNIVAGSDELADMPIKDLRALAGELGVENATTATRSTLLSVVPGLIGGTATPAAGAQ